jgi:hypothetical protein
MYTCTFKRGDAVKKLPLQVYLDVRDRKLLDGLAKRHGLSMAETVRSAIRRWAVEDERGEDPLLELIGTMDEPELSADLSTRHDEYAIGGLPRGGRPGRGSSRGEGP